MRLLTLPLLAVHSSASSFSKSVRSIVSRSRCALFGHDIQSGEPRSIPHIAQRCRCGKDILTEDEHESRVGHIISCFLLGHNYSRVDERSGQVEFICTDCGHPLLLDAKDSILAERKGFHKQVSFACIARSHQVYRVGERKGLTEYACRCGHSFLLEDPKLTRYRHPAACVFRGHYISFVERRGQWSEYRCRVCGHTFCFQSSR